MLASTMQFSKFGQIPFEPMPARSEPGGTQKRGPGSTVSRNFRTQQCVSDN